MQDRSNVPLRFALCTALAAVLVAGCAAKGGIASASSTTVRAASSGLAGEKPVALAEKQVLAAPADVAARVALAQAYLSAGRFQSAASTFEDAIALGDTSPRTALGMALAYVGSGRNSEAVTLLNQWRESIPASDLGLALALAGSTQQGVGILADALRGGEDTPKLRQNLAYAYALDGRWREARLMAAQDVPVDQLDARISEWARQGRPEDSTQRVASLLGAPLRADPGQPAMLALAPKADALQLAAAEVPTPLPPEPYRAPEGQELPPVRTGETFWGGETAAAVERGPVAEARPAESEPVAFAQAFEPVAAPAAEPAPAAPRFVAAPQPRPAPSVKSFEGPLASAMREPAKPRKAATAAAPSRAGSHLVQLGSFSSRERAEKAWSIYRDRNPALRNHQLVVTEAVVRGKRYWRVAAAGFDGGSARSLCSRITGGCIAYAADRPLPGAMPARNGQMLARR